MTIIFRIPAVLAGLIFLMSCAVGYLDKAGNYQSKPQIKIPELEKQVHNRLNRVRQQKGLSPLKWDEELSVIARRHSEDMANRKYFSHYSPEGFSFADRYKKAGFSCGIRIGNTIHGGAENISQDSLFSSIVYRDGIAFYNWNTQEKIAESIVQRWMNSPGHRENILTPHWQTEGIGIVISDDGKVYVTENFC